MPGAEQEIGQMAEMLGGFMTESFSGDAAFGIDETTNSESEKILREKHLLLQKIQPVKCFHQYHQVVKKKLVVNFSNF